jgi:alkanesulfonate monooxygenase SsuD/methylene tetrahydromethanopterin reductase-like flavin-dependent oxidoreductase (luciferase family)
VRADPATQTMRGIAERVAVMKRVWSGEKVTESIRPVGPMPRQPGGPELLVGTMGPKTVRSAAVWADGLAGTTLDLDVGKVAAQVRRHRPRIRLDASALR